MGARWEVTPEICSQTHIENLTEMHLYIFQSNEEDCSPNKAAKVLVRRWRVGRHQRLGRNLHICTTPQEPKKLLYFLTRDQSAFQLPALCTQARRPSLAATPSSSAPGTRSCAEVGDRCGLHERSAAWLPIAPGCSRFCAVLEAFCREGVSATFGALLGATLGAILNASLSALLGEFDMGTTTSWKEKLSAAKASQEWPYF